jgi:hypothetical protein
MTTTSPERPTSPLPPWRGVEIWPVLHDVLELAVAVRQRLLADPPDAIAVELPETLMKPVMRCVDRLPYLSMVHYTTQQGGAVYVPVEPTDAIMEALRFGLERDLPVHLVDRDTETYPLVREGVPDPYAVTLAGYEAYCRAYLELSPRAAVPTDQDEGAVAAEDALREATMAYHLQALADRYDRVLFVCGLDHAARVRALLEQPLVRPIGRLRRDGALPYALDHEAAREVTGEPPFLMAAYEAWRRTGAIAGAPDRTDVQRDLLLAARAPHLEHSGDEVGLQELTNARRFSRNLALVEGRLAPDLFQLLTAARGAVDDDYAYETWDLATAYAHVETPPSLPLIRPTVEELYGHSRSFHFHRIARQRRNRLRSMIRRRPHEKHPGQWKEEWKPGMICSYPPEDLVVEGYGAFLMRKAHRVLSEEASRVEPFTSSLLDGIDVRETVRAWHEGQIYVRENRPVKGKLGAVVVVFDTDEGDEERYPWTLTWQGEHAQESDMALYATAAGEHLIGPGISRCEYGGFLLTYPPGRMFNVWEDPFFDRARTKPERLLLAAIDYCLEKHILYVAARPPRDAYKALAARFGKTLVYLPIGQLSPVTLRRVRHFHVLEGHHARAWAKDFVR